MTASCSSETNDGNECPTSSINSFFFFLIHRERPIGSPEGLLLGVEEARLYSSRV